MFLYYVFLHFFSLLVLLKLLKHVKQIIFKNHNKCKTKHLFLIKNVVTRFDKKNGDMAEKEHWWSKESIIAYPKEEDPISEDSKKTLSLRKDPKENPFNEKPKENPYYCETQRQRYQWRSSGVFIPSMTFAPQINSFWLFSNGHLKVSPVLALGS